MVWIWSWPTGNTILCAYCDGMEASRCPRCSCRLCEAHKPAGDEGWCWACAKEVKDELDLVMFRALINMPNERLPDGSQVPVAIWAEVASWVASYRARRTRRKILERTREEIEAWRREAGIRTR